VPFAGMFNHHSDAKVEHAYSSSSDSLEFKSEVAIAKGEQVYINYGRYSNCHLLRLYGFAMQDNPYDSIDIWATMRYSCTASIRKISATHED
jgi:protein-histidine N-methyltransferase